MVDEYGHVTTCGSKGNTNVKGLENMNGCHGKPQRMNDWKVDMQTFLPYWNLWVNAKMAMCYGMIV